MPKRTFPSFLIFRDKEGRWRWNLAGPGGKIVAASPQAYARRDVCVRAVRLMKATAKVPVFAREMDAKQAGKGAAGAVVEENVGAGEGKKDS